MSNQVSKTPSSRSERNVSLDWQPEPPSQSSPRRRQSAEPFQRGGRIVQIHVDDPDGHFIELFARVDRPDVVVGDRPTIR